MPGRDCATAVKKSQRFKVIYVCFYPLAAKGYKTPESTGAESLKPLQMAGWVQLKTADARHTCHGMTGFGDPSDVSFSVIDDCDRTLGTGI